MNLAATDDCKMTTIHILFPPERVLLSPDLLPCEKAAHVHRRNTRGGAFANIMGSALT